MSGTGNLTSPVAQFVEKFQKWLRRPAVLAAAYFLALTISVVYPWFLDPGFLLLPDFAWTPKLPLPPNLYLAGRGVVSSYPHEWLFWTLSHIVPTDLVQKIALSVVFLLSGLSMFQLMRWLLRRHSSVLTKVSSLTAATFYALNPFVFFYVFEGVYYHLLAYALTPWVVLATLKFLERPRTGTGLAAGALAALVMLTNAHHVLLLLLFLPLLFISRRTVHVPGRALIAFSLPLALFALASAPAFVVGTARVAALDQAGPWTRSLRAPFSGNLLADVLALTARWAPDVRSTQPYEQLPFFGILTAMLLATMVVGVIGYWRGKETGPLVRRLLLTLGVMSFLTIGVAHQATAPVSGWLYRHVPFWTAMRDTTKFLALIALVESVFLGFGSAALSAWAERMQRARRFVPVLYALPALLFAGTLALASPALHGFSGQVLPTEYPASWTEWNEHLAEVPARARMVFLPWVMYPYLRFIGYQGIINPAPAFFTNADVLAGNVSMLDDGRGGLIVERVSVSPFSLKVESLLRDASLTALGSELRDDGIRYIAVTLDSPVGSDLEAFLRRQADLRLVFARPDFLVWENTAL